MPRDRSKLTARQQEILEAYQRLGTMKAVAEHFGLGYSTITSTLKAIELKQRRKDTGAQREIVKAHVLARIAKRRKSS